jgi:hypothetical protein
LQSKDVGAGAVKGKKNVDIGAKMLLKLPDSGAGVGIVAVGDYVTLVRAGNRCEDLWVDASVIVAGEAASRLGENLIHTETLIHIETM